MNTVDLKESLFIFIIKRNGDKVKYDGNKILSAIAKSMSEGKKGVDEKIATKIEQDIFEEISDESYQALFTVESIQDKIEDGLMKYGRYNTARRYIKYRAERDKVRDELINWKSYRNFEFLSNEFLKKYANDPDPFKTELSKFTFYRTYSRFLPSENRRETWLEMNARVANYLTEIDPVGNSNSAEILFDNLFNFKVFSSGRIRYTGGTDSIKKNFQSAFNCSGMKIDNVDKFSESMTIALLGCGVGFSVYKEDIEKIQPIRQDIEVIMKNYEPVKKYERQELTTTKLYNNSIMEIIIGDSKAGWSGALRQYFDITTNRGMSSAERVVKTILFNFDNIRPKGERLKTFGGTASGHIPLMKTLQGINNTIKNSEGKKITRGRIKMEGIDMADIMTFIAEAVVSGGVRRSSLLDLFDYDNEKIKNSKTNLYVQENGNWIANEKLLHRRLSNNTIMYREKPTREVLNSHLQTMRFTGEPAIANLEEMHRRKPNADLSNPCFTGDMKLLTQDGYKRFDDLVGTKPMIINKDGNISQSKIWSSGIKNTIKLKTSLGKEITCTPDHVFMTVDGKSCEAKDLKKKRIMPLLIEKTNNSDLMVKYGFIQGDGCTGRLNSTTHKGIEVCIGEDDKDIFNLFNLKYLKNKKTVYMSGHNEELKNFGFSAKSLPERILPTEYYNLTKSEKSDFMQGLFSANGSVIKSHRISFKGTCKNLIDQIKLSLIDDFGIKSYITTNKKKKNKFSNGEYECRESYDLNISAYDDVIKFSENIGFYHKYKKDALSELILSKAPMVISILKNGQQEVFDFEEPLVHWGVVEGAIVHNCFEILLQDRQHCNLTIINMMGFINDDNSIDTEGIKLNIALATKMAFIISLQELDLLEWERVAESDRIIGVSLTGWQDFVNKTKITREKKVELLNFMRDVTYEENERLAKLYNVKKADLVTSMQPAGTVSILPDSVSSGMHFSHSPYYIRRVRVNSSDPIAFAMIDSGFKWKPEVGRTIENHTTKVFEFPTKAPKGKTKYDVSAIEQLEEYKLLMENYCDQNVSSTVHVRNNEWNDVEQWLWDNWNSFVGISFLSLDDNFYELLPYEAITEDEYNKLSNIQPKLNIDYLAKYETGEDFEIDETSGCESGNCPIR